MSFFGSRAFRALLAAAVVLFLAAGAGGLWFYDEFLRDLPDLRRIEDYRPALTSVVLDRKGRLIGEFYEENRRLVPIGEIPRHSQLAFVAAEDKSFFEHKGLDYSSILRAALANLRGGGIRQGASTITQQTVKSLLLTPERTFRRKFREMILARRLEEHFTKDEILYLYVNQIYFGHGAWGIGQAARAYFGKDVSDLTISESALLAGLPQRPSDYSPYRNPESAERRRLYVLERMMLDGFITEDEYEEAVASPPEIHGPEDEEGIRPAAHFTELVRRYLFDRLGGDEVLRGGLVIETTVDLELQKAAVAAVRAGLEAHDRRQGYRGPIRRVARADIEAELARLAEENADAFVHPVPDDEATDESGAPVEGEAADTPDVAANAEASEAGEPTDAGAGPGDGIAEADGSAAPTPPELPIDEPVVGVVLEVDGKAQQARVGFAPGLEGIVHLEDVTWAWKSDPDRRRWKVERIGTVFSVGDVTRFVRMEEDDAEADEDVAEAEAASEEGDPEAPPEPVRVALFQAPIVQGALLSIDNDTGDVIALVGGYDYERSEFNRAVQARRQPGSAFKPFIYGAALERGYTPVSEVVDRPVVYTDPVSGFVWAPRNYGRQFHGPMPMRDALKKSINNATVHLFRDVGVDFVIDYARRFGIQSPLSRDLSLALGSSSVTLLELTTAYSVFPNKGRRVVPRFILRVTTRDGQVLLEDVPLGPAPPPVLRPLSDDEGATTVADYPDGEILPTDQVISEAAAYLMCDLLKAVVQEGTGRRLRKLGRPLAGKTGTTNEQGDAWFMGFSPDITTGVWVGHDDNRELGFGETGAGAALPIWGDYMKVALASRPIRDFDVPSENIVFARIDRGTGLLADASSRDAYFQPFIEGTEPQRTVSQSESASDARRALRDDIF
jgi:penicillin-binding protein 1A